MILLSSTYFISYSLGYGKSTNTRSELLALWALLTVAYHLGIPLLSVYGDSQVVISWVNKKCYHLLGKEKSFFERPSSESLV